MLDIWCCISWPENHHMHHRTSTDSIRQSTCDIWCCISWPENHNMHHRTSTDSIFTCRCAISGFVSLGQKNTKILAHRPIRLASRCAISGFVSLGQKITTCIIAHRPIRLASRCAISGFVSLGPKITTCIIAHRPIRSPVDVRYLFLYILARKTRKFSHIDRFDSPVDVRYVRYLALYLLSLGQRNHNMHHRTSTVPIRPSMCDIGR